MENNGRFRRINGWKTLAVLLIVVIAAGAISFTGIFLIWRAEGHAALRRARNVWLSIRLTKIEYYADGTDMYDVRRVSGLKEHAEQQARKLSMAEGDFIVLSHSGEEGLPTAMIYYEDPYVVYFHLDEEENRQFDVYRGAKLVQVNSSEQASFPE